MAETINIKPSWSFALSIYLMVLENPDASPKAIKDAKDDLAEMAKAADKWNAYIEEDEIKKMNESRSYDEEEEKV